MFLDTDGFCPCYMFRCFPMPLCLCFAFLPITSPTVVSHPADQPCPVTVPLTHFHSCTENVIEGGRSAGCVRFWCRKNFHPTFLQLCNWQRSLNCGKYPASSLTRSTMRWILCISSTRREWGSIRISKSKKLWWVCVGPDHSLKKINK